MYQQMYTKIKDGQGENSFEHLIHGKPGIYKEEFNYFLRGVWSWF
jgi:hypothetical protein